MSPRLKKLLGIFIILPGLFAYFVLVITIADFLPKHWLIQIIYFAITGIIWIFPFKPLFQWMNSEPS